MRLLAALAALTLALPLSGSALAPSVPAAPPSGTDRSSITESFTAASTASPAGPAVEPSGGPSTESSTESFTSEPVPLRVDGADVADLPALPEVARDPGTAASAESGSESGGYAACTTRTFTDVPRGSTFYPYVSWMSCEGLTIGYRDGSFGVNRQMTRGEAAVFLYRLSGESHDAGQEVDFPDVLPGTTAFTAVSWLRAEGYATGYADRSFGQNRDISRGELAALLYRMSGASYPVRTYSPYTDMTSRTTYFREATWLHSTGIITGYVDRTFRHPRSITRGEASKFLYSFDQVREGTKPASVNDRWTTVATPVHATAAPRTAPKRTLPPQTGVLRLAEQGRMTQVRMDSTTGWVNSDFLSRGRPGTTAEPFPGTTTYTGRASNNIAPWCWNIPMTTFDGTDAWARYRWEGDPAWPSTLAVDEMIGLGDDLDPDFIPAQSVQLHECAHILQYRAYRYDEQALVARMERIYPGGTAGGVEHMADCMADAMGARRVYRTGDQTWTAGYGGSCTSTQMSAARKVIAGLRP